MELLQKDAGSSLSEKSLLHLKKMFGSIKQMGNLIDGNRPATPYGVRGAAGSCTLHGASEPADC
jgi:hypothetical protein